MPLWFILSPLTAEITIIRTHFRPRITLVGLPTDWSDLCSCPIYDTAAPWPFSCHDIPWILGLMLLTDIPIAITVAPYRILAFRGFANDMNDRPILRYIRWKRSSAESYVTTFPCLAASHAMGTGKNTSSDSAFPRIRYCEIGNTLQQDTIFWRGREDWLTNCLRLTTLSNGIGSWIISIHSHLCYWVMQ
jgi:hypothetical protein